MAAYATRKDLYRYGLARGALGMQGREVASVSTSADTLELDGHGFETDDELVFRAESGGSLPSPLVAGTTYYAIRVNESRFQVAAAAAGSAIDLTTSGSNVVVAYPLPFDEVLSVYSRIVDSVVPHLVPLTAPYPELVVATVAELAAKKLMLLAEQSSESMAQVEIEAKARLAAWAKGQPIRDSRATASANLAISDGGGGGDSRGWGDGGTLP